MFVRIIEKSLFEWKESLKIRKSAFILKGLRQIGKTFIIRKFAKVKLGEYHVGVNNNIVTLPSYMSFLL